MKAPVVMACFGAPVKAFLAAAVKVINEDKDVNFHVAFNLLDDGTNPRTVFVDERISADFLEVIGKRTQLMGAEHPDTLRAMNLLGSCYTEQDRHPEAIAVYTRVLELRRKALGDTPPEPRGPRSAR